MLLHIYNMLRRYNKIQRTPSTTTFPTLKTEMQLLISSALSVRQPTARAEWEDFHQRPSAKSPHTKQLVKNQKSFSEEQVTSNTRSATITSTETLWVAGKKLNCALFPVLPRHPAVTEQPYFHLWSKLHMLACTESRQVGRADRKYLCPLNTAALAVASWRRYQSRQNQFKKNKRHQTVIDSSRYTNAYVVLPCLF